MLLTYPFVKFPPFGRTDGPDSCRIYSSSGNENRPLKGDSVWLNSDSQIGSVLSRGKWEFGAAGLGMEGYLAIKRASGVKLVTTSRIAFTQRGIRPSPIL